MEVQGLVDALLQHSVTRGELLRRVGTIRDFLEQKFFKPDSLDLDAFLNRRHIDGDPDVIKNLGDDFYSSFSRENVYQQLDAMAKIISLLPSIVLYIPFELNDELSAKFGAWFREHVDNQLLVDAKTDAGALGGCAVVSGGIWHDFTLKYWMKKKQAEIVETIGKYVNG